MGKKISALAVIGLCLLTGMSGCSAVVAGGAAAGATYSYVKGWVSRDYNAGLDRSLAAVLSAAGGLQMTVLEKTKEVASAYIKAKKGDEEYRIKLDEKNERLTRISVRSGIVGNLNASEKIHKQIEKHL